MNLTITRGISFLPITVTVEDASGAIDLTGWSVFSDARSIKGGPVSFSLSPTITDAATGEITIPEKDADATALLTGGRYYWDLVLENTDGQRLGPYLSGLITIDSAQTQP